MALKPNNIFSRLAAWWFMHIAKGCFGCFWLQTFLAGFVAGWLIAITMVLLNVIVL